MSKDNLENFLHVSNWADDVDDEPPEEPPSEQAAPAAQADPLQLLLEELQHTFEVGPFPGALSDKEVGRFMSQWRVTNIATQGAGFFYVSFVSPRDYLDCTRSRGFLNTFEKLQAKPVSGPLIEAAARKGLFQPLQPGSTTHWDPETTTEARGFSWRRSSGAADHYAPPPPPSDTRWRPGGAPPPSFQPSQAAPLEGQPAAPKPKSNPFGSARPVDTASRYSIFERKTAEEKSALAAQELAAEGRKHSRDLPPLLMQHLPSRGASGSREDPRNLVHHNPAFPPKMLRRPTDPEPLPLVQPLASPPEGGHGHLALPPPGPRAVVLPPFPHHNLHSGAHIPMHPTPTGPVPVGLHAQQHHLDAQPHAVAAGQPPHKGGTPPAGAGPYAVRSQPPGGVPGPIALAAGKAESATEHPHSHPVLHAHMHPQPPHPQPHLLQHPLHSHPQHTPSPHHIQHIQHIQQPQPQLPPHLHHQGQHPAGPTLLSFGSYGSRTDSLVAPPVHLPPPVFGSIGPTGWVKGPHAVPAAHPPRHVHAHHPHYQQQPHAVHPQHSQYLHPHEQPQQQGWEDGRDAEEFGGRKGREGRGARRGAKGAGGAEGEAGGERKQGGRRRTGKKGSRVAGREDTVGAAGEGVWERAGSYEASRGGGKQGPEPAAASVTGSSGEVWAERAAPAAAGPVARPPSSSGGKSRGGGKQAGVAAAATAAASAALGSEAGSASKAGGAALATTVAPAAAAAAAAAARGAKEGKRRSGRERASRGGDAQTQDGGKGQSGLPAAAGAPEGAASADRGGKTTSGKGGGKGGGPGQEKERGAGAKSGPAPESKAQQLYKKQTPPQPSLGATTTNAFALLMEAGDE